jgi:tight adherence protein C
MIFFALTFGLTGVAAAWFLIEWKDEWRARRYFSKDAALPVLWLRWRRRQAKWRRFKEFPDFLEFASLGLSSGLNLDRAWEEAVRFLPAGPLQVELRRTANDFSLGRPRKEAITDLARRLDDDRLAGPLGLLSHALKYGTPLEELLLDQAKRLREAVLLALERRAQTAGLRLLFPLVFFILPTLFIILFGPLALGFLETGRLF